MSEVAKTFGKSHIGIEQGLDFLEELLQFAFEKLDVVQQVAQQDAVGGIDAAFQGLTQLRQLGPQASAGQLGQGVGRTFARKHGLEHVASALAQHIAGHRGEFDVGRL